MILLEPINQHRHPVVLLLDYIARLLQGRKVALLDADGVRAPDRLAAAVDGRVVAGEVRGHADVLGFEPGNLGDLLADDVLGEATGVVGVFGGAGGGVVGFCGVLVREIWGAG